MTAILAIAPLQGGEIGISYLVTLSRFLKIIKFVFYDFLIQDIRPIPYVFPESEWKLFLQL